MSERRPVPTRARILVLNDEETAYDREVGFVVVTSGNEPDGLFYVTDEAVVDDQEANRLIREFFPPDGLPLRSYRNEISTDDAGLLTARKETDVEQVQMGDTRYLHAVRESVVRRSSFRVSDRRAIAIIDYSKE